jgi:hypothetical protein
MPGDTEPPSLAEIDAALAAVLVPHIWWNGKAEGRLRATGRAGLLRVLGLWYQKGYPPQPPFDDPLKDERDPIGRIDSWNSALATVATANGSAYIDEIEAGRVRFDPGSGSGAVDVVINLASLDDPRALPLIERCATSSEWLVRYHAARSRAENALLRTLTAFFAGRSDVFVASGCPVLYLLEERFGWIRPDALVAVGAPKLPPRFVYRVWDEGVPPTVIINVTTKLGLSGGSDEQRRAAAWATMGVAECFYCHLEYESPRLNQPDPQFAGFRLDGGVYRPIEPEADGALRSEALGLLLRREEGGRLALFDARTGVRLRPNGG